MEIPRILEKWIVAYAKLSDREYEFIVRDFPVPRVRIRAEKMRVLKRYSAQSNYNIKRSGEEEFTSIMGTGENPEQAIIDALTQMLTQGKVVDVETNNYYWMVLH
jgi:hypothetical protein